MTPEILQLLVQGGFAGFAAYMLYLNNQDRQRYLLEMEKKETRNESSQARFFGIIEENNKSINSMSNNIREVRSSISSNTQAFEKMTQYLERNYELYGKLTGIIEIVSKK